MIVGSVPYCLASTCRYLCSRGLETSVRYSLSIFALKYYYWSFPAIPSESIGHFKIEVDYLVLLSFLLLLRKSVQIPGGPQWENYFLYVRYFEEDSVI